MGAYYQWQLQKGNKIEVVEPDYLKFLESFYHFNFHTQAVMRFIKEAGEPVIVNTVCDYDEHKEWLDATITISESEVEHLNCGYLVNDKTKTYFSLTKFIEFKNQLNTEHSYRNWLISPLALLTRSTPHAQGGGDFDIDDLEHNMEQFGSLPEFNADLVGSWADSEVRYTENPIPNYKDISEEIACYEKY